MAKLPNPFLGLSVSGSISGALTYLSRMRHHIVEKTPTLQDRKTTAQLSWRHMFLKVVALWHALSAAEKAEWESAARPKHMTGYAWFVSQALRPNPGIYLPLQGGTMQGIIDMDGYPMQDLLDPVGPQDGDTKAARDAAIAAAIAGSLTCDIYGYDGSNWQKLLVESAAQHNLRVRLYYGPNAVDGIATVSSIGATSKALYTQSAIRAYQDGVLGIVYGEYGDVDGLGTGNRGLFTMNQLLGFNGATWDRLRSYGTGILKVGRAEIGLSTLRLTGTGQVKASSGNLYWMNLNPSAGSSSLELSDDTDGSSAVVLDHFDTTRDGHMMTFDPPMQFTTGIYLKALANMTSITFGYK